ncbi:MAG TPA: cupin domain-containing protein [Terriglobales bacterium]
MQPLIIKQDLTKEFTSEERCYILETSNSTDDTLSITRARVAPGITTKWHEVRGTVERYIIAEGRGRVEVGDLPAQNVGPGDIVLIPPGIRQRITNAGPADLIFYCVCTPRFQQSAYRSLE